MVNALYSVIDGVCFFILAVIIINLHLTPNKNDTLKYNLILNYLVISFIGLDLIYGLFASLTIHSSNLVIYLIVTVMCFLLAFIAFMWFFFVEYSLNGSFSFHRVFRIGAYLLFFLNLIILFSNPWTNVVFKQLDSFYFYPSSHWLYFQILQFIFYVFALIRSVFIFITKWNWKYLKKMTAIISFSILPIGGCLLKVDYEHIPWLSISYLLSICIIYIFNMTQEKEKLNILLHEAENLSKLEEGEQIIHAVTDSYDCLYLFKMDNQPPKVLIETDLVKSMYETVEDKTNTFFEILRKNVNPSYVDDMLMFADLHSLEKRLENNKFLMHEFLDGSNKWCRAAWITVTRDQEGFLSSVLFGIRNIDSEKRKELEYERKLKEALKNQNEIYAEILQMQSNGTLVTDMQSNILMINDSAKRIFDVTDEEIKKLTVDELMEKYLGDSFQSIKKKIHTVKVKGGHFSFDMSVNNEKLGEIFLSVESKLVKTSLGEKILITTFMDITKNKKVENDLIILSQTDSLTGINNRGSGARKIEYLFSKEKQGMLCILDADNFKFINDSYGHIAGDKVIITIAECMKKSFRDKDVIMRLGGDEFAMYAVGITDEETGTACINRFFDEIRKNKSHQISDLDISVSLGAVFCDDLKNNTFDDYYQMADRAMYKSKEYKGLHFEFFNQVK